MQNKEIFQKLFQDEEGNKSNVKNIQKIHNKDYDLDEYHMQYGNGVKVIAIEKSDTQTSLPKVDNIIFSDATTSTQLVVPPLWDIDVYQFRDMSFAMSDCISTVARFLTAFGYRLVRVNENRDVKSDKTNKIDKEIEEIRNKLNNFTPNILENRLSELIEEKVKLEEKEIEEQMIKEQEDKIHFIMNNLHPEMTYMDVIKLNIASGLLFGYYGNEIVFDDLKTSFQMFPIPTHELQMSRVDPPEERTYYTITDKDGKKHTFSNRFRRYAQVQYESTEGKNEYLVFFKHRLDPRLIDKNTGEVKKREEITEEDEANVIWWENMGNETQSIYNSPIWWGVMNDIQGLFHASKLNNEWFSEGLILPAMFVVNGQINQEAYDEIVQLFDGARGKRNKVLLLDAANAKTLNEIKGEVFEQGSIQPFTIEKIDLPALEISEGQFLKYIDDGIRNIRMTFNIPAILLGLEESYNRSTVEMAIEVANQNLHGLKTKIENMYNTLFKDCGIHDVEMKLNTPSMTNYTDIARLLKIYTDADILPVDALRSLIEELLNMKDLERYDTQTIEEFKQMRSKTNQQTTMPGNPDVKDGIDEDSNENQESDND